MYGVIHGLAEPGRMSAARQIDRKVNFVAKKMLSSYESEREHLDMF